MIGRWSDPRLAVMVRSAFTSMTGVARVMSEVGQASSGWSTRCGSRDSGGAGRCRWNQAAQLGRMLKGIPGSGMRSTRMTQLSSLDVSIVWFCPVWTYQLSGSGCPVLQSSMPVSRICSRYGSPYPGCGWWRLLSAERPDAGTVGGSLDMSPTTPLPGPIRKLSPFLGILLQKLEPSSV